jgi:multisubunit Na+/H+ antiporter MnhF subunit
MQLEFSKETIIILSVGIIVTTIVTYLVIAQPQTSDDVAIITLILAILIGIAIILRTILKPPTSFDVNNC